MVQLLLSVIIVCHRHYWKYHCRGSKYAKLYT